MGSFLVVVFHPDSDVFLSLEPVLHLPQIDALVFQRSPQSLDEDVVHPPTTAVHRYSHAGLLQRVGEVIAGELTPLVGVEDLRRSVTRQRLLQSLDAEVRVHGVG